MGKGSGTSARPALTLGDAEAADRSPAVADASGTDEGEPLRPAGSSAWTTSCNRFRIERESTDSDAPWRVVAAVGLLDPLRGCVASSTLLTRRFTTRRRAVKAIARVLEKSDSSPMPDARLHRGVNVWVTEDDTISVTRFSDSGRWLGSIKGLPSYGSFAGSPPETRGEAIREARRIQSSLGLVTEADARELSRRVALGELRIERRDGLEVVPRSMGTEPPRARR